MSNLDQKLFDAAVNENWEEAIALVGKGATNRYRDGSGWTALHWAAAGNSAKFISAILNEDKHQIDVETDFGETPLREAILFNNPSCIEEIMKWKPKQTIIYCFGKINKNKFKYSSSAYCRRNLKIVLKDEEDPVESIYKMLEDINTSNGFDDFKSKYLIIFTIFIIIFL